MKCFLISIPPKEAAGFSDLLESKKTASDKEEVELENSAFNTDLRYSMITRNHRICNKTGYALKKHGRFFVSCYFEGVEFSKANLCLCSFYNCSFINCTFNDCMMKKTGYFACNFENTIIRETIFSYARIIHCDIQSLSFYDCDIKSSLFILSKDSENSISFNLCNDEEAYINE